MRRSSMQRTPAPISGWRRRISSNIATGRRPGALFNKGTISLSQTSASGSRRLRPSRAFFLRRQPWILFDTIGGGGAEPGFGRRNGRRLDLAQTHIQPHLPIGDVAAGQAAVPNRGEEPASYRPTAIARKHGPLRGRAGSPNSQLRSGYALPSSRIRRHSLILIDVLFSSCSPLNNPCRKEIRFVWDLEISLASLENQINKVL